MYYWEVNLAQVLKEEVRESIIRGALIEFYNKGFDNSSLRQIALGAGITPGNLYRYFESKEDLYEYIVGSTYKKLNTILKETTNNMIGIDREVSIDEFVQLSNESMAGKFADQIIDQIIDVFEYEKLALIILLKDDRADFAMNSRFKLIDWIAFHLKLIYQDDELAQDLAYSFIEGVILITTSDSDNLKERLSKFVEFYFLRGIGSDD